MTAQEKQLVEDLWNTDPAKASEDVYKRQQ